MEATFNLSGLPLGIPNSPLHAFIIDTLKDPVITFKYRELYKYVTPIDFDAYKSAIGQYCPEEYYKLTYSKVIVDADYVCKEHLEILKNYDCHITLGTDYCEIEASIFVWNKLLKCGSVLFVGTLVEIVDLLSIEAMTILYDGI